MSTFRTVVFRARTTEGRPREADSLRHRWCGWLFRRTAGTCRRRRPPDRPRRAPRGVVGSGVKGHEHQGRLPRRVARERRPYRHRAMRLRALFRQVVRHRRGGGPPRPPYRGANCGPLGPERHRRRRQDRARRRAGHVMGVSHTCSPGSSNPASSPIREGRRASCSGDGWLAQRTRTGLLGRMQEGGHRRRARQRHSAGAVGQVCVHLCPGGNDRGGQPPHWGCANGRGVLGRVQANCRGGAPAGRSRGGRAARATSRNRDARFTEGLEPTVYSSLYDDLSNGRRMELEALHGTIVQSLRQHDIPVPVSETIYAILKPWAVRNEAPTTL
jgi:hypothetical protein